MISIAAARVRILVFAALVLLSWQAPAQATGPTPAPGQFGISPPRRHVVGEPGSELVPTTVINTTPDRYQVEVIPVLLTQELSGTFQYSSTPTDVATASRYLAVSPTSFDLTPDHQQRVTLHWSGMPPGKPELVIGVIFRGVAIHQNAPVHVASQLLSINFLRLPSATTVRGEFTRIQASQAPKRVLAITPRVENTGDRAWAPADANVVIRDATGTVVDRVPWFGDVVIPGAQRDFQVPVTKLLPAGHYTMQATMRFGARQTISGSFTLAGPNQLPTPTITVPYFNAGGAVGTPAVVATRVASAGSAPAGIALHVTVTGTGGRALGRYLHASTTLTYANLAPGAVRKRFLTLGPPLVAGDYQVTGTWTDAAGVPHTVQSGFTATIQPSSTNKLWHWFTGHLVFILGALALVLIAAWLLRRQRRLERELAEAKAAARASADPASVPSDHDPQS